MNAPIRPPRSPAWPKPVSLHLALRIGPGLTGTESQRGSEGAGPLVCPVPGMGWRGTNYFEVGFLSLSSNLTALDETGQGVLHSAEFPVRLHSVSHCRPFPGLLSWDDIWHPLYPFAQPPVGVNSPGKRHLGLRLSLARSEPAASPAPCSRPRAPSPAGSQLCNMLSPARRSALLPARHGGLNLENSQPQSSSRTLLCSVPGVCPVCLVWGRCRVPGSTCFLGGEGRAVATTRRQQASGLMHLGLLRALLQGGRQSPGQRRERGRAVSLLRSTFSV